MCRWHHPYGRKQRGTKQPLDERGEWKRWLKTQHSKNEDDGIWSHHLMANRRGKSENSDKFSFLGLQKSLEMVTAAMKLKDPCSLEGKLWQTWKTYLKQRHNFADIGLYSPSYIFPSSHVQMWNLDHKEGWALKVWALELRYWRRLFRVPWTVRR